MAGERLCPGCGYDLSGLGLERRTGDCPECGWRMPAGTGTEALRERMRTKEGPRRCGLCGRDLSGESEGVCPACGSKCSVRR